MKKSKKIIFLLLMLCIITQIFISVFCKINAITLSDYKPNVVGNNNIQSKIITVISVITSVGMVASVVILGIMGIKYMIGSVEEKVEYKKDLVPYFVGAILLLGINTIVKILMAFGTNIANY